MNVNLLSLNDKQSIFLLRICLYDNHFVSIMFTIIRLLNDKFNNLNIYLFIYAYDISIYIN